MGGEGNCGREMSLNRDRDILEGEMRISEFYGLLLFIGSTGNGWNFVCLAGIHT